MQIWSTANEKKKCPPNVNLQVKIEGKMERSKKSKVSFCGLFYLKNTKKNVFIKMLSI